MKAPEPVRRVALVTGATSGAGRDVCRRLAAEGWDIALGWHSAEARAAELVAECRAAGANVRAARLDVTDDATAAAFVARAVSDLGRLDGLVNLASWAAPGGGYRVPLERLDLEWVRRSCDVDLVGTLRMIRICAPHLRASGAGAIVNYGSASANASDPDLHAYLGAKVAVAAYTVALARELGPTVRVNCLAPGAIRTDWFDRWKMPPGEEAALAAASCVGRVGEARDLTEAALFLLSERASFVTGQVLAVDGGLFAP